MKTEITENYLNSSYDEFIRQLIPFGSMDIAACVKTAAVVNLSMQELAEIITQYCEDTDTNLFDEKTVDINAILNDYIIQQARQELDEIIQIDICDLDLYFYANYLDCPLQYKEEDAEIILKSLQEKNVNWDDLSDYTQYLLDEMGLSDSLSKVSGIIEGE